MSSPIWLIIIVGILLLGLLWSLTQDDDDDDFDYRY